VRSVLYRFPNLDEFERVLHAAGVEAELGVPAGENVEDGEWVLAIFELGSSRRATSAAGRGVTSPDGARLVFEPRDVKRLAEFAARDAGHEAKALRDGVASDPKRSVTIEPPTEPRPPASGDVEQRRASRPSLTDPRVLIVDDDPDIREVVTAMLEAVGLMVVAVESGEDALDRVLSEAFDLLVLDWNLPSMTGLDLCRALRKDPGLAGLPVLFLTANDSSQDMVEAFASGGDDYVVKPFRAPELGARIFSLLRRARRGSGGDASSHPPRPAGSTQ
jgi:two-component system, OmpR family, phosphate regulon response regulator PhoB